MFAPAPHPPLGNQGSILSFYFWSLLSNDHLPAPLMSQPPAQDHLTPATAAHSEWAPNSLVSAKVGPAGGRASKPLHHLSQVPTSHPNHWLRKRHLSSVPVPLSSFSHLTEAHPLGHQHRKGAIWERLPFRPCRLLAGSWQLSVGSWQHPTTTSETLPAPRTVLVLRPGQESPPGPQQPFKAKVKPLPMRGSKNKVTQLHLWLWVSHGPSLNLNVLPCTTEITTRIPRRREAPVQSEGSEAGTDRQTPWQELARDVLGDSYHTPVQREVGAEGSPFPTAAPVLPRERKEGQPPPPPLFRLPGPSGTGSQSPQQGEKWPHFMGN